MEEINEGKAKNNDDRSESILSQNPPFLFTALIDRKREKGNEKTNE